MSSETLPSPSLHAPESLVFGPLFPAGGPPAAQAQGGGAVTPSLSRSQSVEICLDLSQLSFP